MSTFIWMVLCKTHNVPVKIQFCQVQKLLQLWQHKDLNLQYFWIPVHRTEECFQVHWEQLGQFYCPWLLTNHTEEEYSPAVPRTWKGLDRVQIEQLISEGIRVYSINRAGLCQVRSKKQFSAQTRSKKELRTNEPFLIYYLFYELDFKTQTMKWTFIETKINPKNTMSCHLPEKTLWCLRGKKVSKLLSIFTWLALLFPH